jgi:hypothetical protein
MLENELKWFFETHREILRKLDSKGYETLMLMSLGHVFNLYNPKELSDYLGILHQGLYKHLKRFS